MGNHRKKVRNAYEREIEDANHSFQNGWISYETLKSTVNAVVRMRFVMIKER